MAHRSGLINPNLLAMTRLFYINFLLIFCLKKFKIVQVIPKNLELFQITWDFPSLDLCVRSQKGGRNVLPTLLLSRAYHATRSWGMIRKIALLNQRIPANCQSWPDPLQSSDQVLHFCLLTSFQLDQPSLYFKKKNFFLQKIDFYSIYHLLTF